MRMGRGQGGKVNRAEELVVELSPGSVCNLAFSFLPML